VLTCAVTEGAGVSFGSWLGDVRAVCVPSKARPVLCGMRRVARVVLVVCGGYDVDARTHAPWGANKLDEGFDTGSAVTAEVVEAAKQLQQVLSCSRCVVSVVGAQGVCPQRGMVQFDRMYRCINICMMAV